MSSTESAFPDSASGFLEYEFKERFSDPTDNATEKPPTSPLANQPAALTFSTLRRNNVDKSPVNSDDSTEFAAHGFVDRIGPESAVQLDATFWNESGECLPADRASFGCQGLASYLCTCWAQEKGVVLRPDMI